MSDSKFIVCHGWLMTGLLVDGWILAIACLSNAVLALYFGMKDKT